MARKTFIQKYMIIAVALTIVQAISMIYFKSQAPETDTKTVIKRIEQERGEWDYQDVVIAQTHTALGAYLGDHMTYPQRLEELVPKYLSKVPIDPHTFKPIKYTRTGGAYILGNPADMVQIKGKDNKQVKTVIKKIKEDQSSSSARLQHFINQQLSENYDYTEKFTYNPRGKKDPFKPFDARQVAEETDPNSSPLERYELGQLKLKAILNQKGEFVAIVEDSAGAGFIIKKGTKIGNSGGVVSIIDKDKIVVLENEIDFTGKEKRRITEIKIRKQPRLDPEIEYSTR